MKDSERFPVPKEDQTLLKTVLGDEVFETAMQQRN